MIRFEDRKSMACRFLPIILIGITGLTAYWNSFEVPFQFDDYGFSIGKNRPISTISDIKDIVNSYPARSIGLLSFSINLTLAKNNVFYFHLVNLVIHLINGILLYHFLLRLLTRFQDVEEGNSQTSIIPALFAAIVFTCHPVQMQAVTYITQRFTSLTVLFYLSSILCYLNYIEYRNSDEKRARNFLCFAVGCCILANLTKEIAATLPLTWFLIEVVIAGAKPVDLLRRRRLIFFMILTLTLPFIFLFLGNSPSQRDIGTKFTPGLYKYFLTQVLVVVEYLRLFIIPVNQNLDYDFPIQESIAACYFLFCFSVHLVLISTAICLRHRRRLISFGLLFFYLGLLPESSFLPLPDMIFEHRLYLPGIGLLVCIASLCHSFITFRFCKFRLSKRYYFFISSLVALLIVISLIVATQLRNNVWHTRESLWRDVLKKSPRKLRPHQQIGIIYWGMHKFEKAENHFKMVTTIDPQFSGGHNNLGITLVHLGRVNEAIVAFEKAIAHNSNNPEYWRNYGQALQTAGKFDQAEKVLRECINKFSGYSPCKSRLEKVKREKARSAKIDEY